MIATIERKREERPIKLTRDRMRDIPPAATMEREEDEHFGKIAEERRKVATRYVSHEEAWK